ncbi:hypothetical protein [Nocardioides sp.]|uniref:hypothetical protein n=1 Tax=Nocardioides sp. TaxID=35761 RepID=UPI00321A63E9
MMRPRLLRRPLLAMATSLALAVPLSAIALAPGAQAAVTGPADGSTVSGNVAIAEARGATSNCVSGGSGGSRLTVTRSADNAVVHTASKSGTGSYSTTWSSIGQPRGEYVVRSYARDGKKSGFLNLGCSNQGESLLSTVTISLDNGAGVDITLPASVVTGEDLDVEVATSVVATGFTGQPLGGRTVTISVPGVGSDQVVTDTDGLASTSFDLPDLPVGVLEVSAEVADDPAYSGRDATASTTLVARSTATYYRGDTRGEPGTEATLEGLVVDATPGSDRFGDPVVGAPLALAFGDDVAEVETVASGRALRTVPVRGQSRLVPVTATYAGSSVYIGSDDEVTFYVGDAAAAPAPVQSGPAGSTTTAVGGLLGSLLGSLLGDDGPLVLDTQLPILGGAVGNEGLANLLDTLLGPVQPVLAQVGDPVDDALQQILDGLADTPLGDLTETARFEWRAVLAQPDGATRRAEFDAVIGVPQPLDVDGDGRADVLANVTLAELSPTSIVPRIEVARVGDVSATLPLSLQALVDLPGGDDTYRFGYDTREGDAPRSFTADVVVADGGAALEVAGEGDSPVEVTGAIVPATGPGEQRFGVSFSQVPTSASLGLDLGGAGGAQNIAASLRTDEPTEIGLSLVDDSGAAEVFSADGTLDSVDGDLAVVLSGTEETGLVAEITSDAGLDSLALTATALDAGRTVSDVRLALSDVPDVVSFGLTADGAGELTASGPIGVFEAGYASGRHVLGLDDPAYLRLLQRAETQSIAVRLPGFEGLDLDLGDEVSLGLTLAPTPLRALIDQDGRVLDARIDDAPHQLALALSPDGAVRVEGSAPISEVTVEATDEDGILDGASNLSLRLVDVPALLSVGITDDGVVFDTGGDAVGLLEVFADNGTRLAVPGGGDGLLVRNAPDGTALAGRISGLRRVEASLGSAPEVLLDTVAGEVFSITLREVDENGASEDVTATLDRLVPDMRLALVDDGSGATRLSYSAAEATDSLSFDFGGLSGSISAPLPADLQICIAGDEACLPEVGIADPDLGSIRFAASETTTLNLTDAEGGLQARDLRLRVLDITGSLDVDNGGDVYLNTTEFGGECGAQGCVRPIEGGRVDVNLGSAGLRFDPGNGFFAKDAITHLKVDKLFGQPIGLSGTGGTGEVTCVSATKLDVTVYDVPVLGDITLSVKDAICDVDRD